MLRDTKYRYQRIPCITESRVSSFLPLYFAFAYILVLSPFKAIEGKVVTLLTWTQQIKCRRLSEQPNDIRLATKS